MCLSPEMDIVENIVRIVTNLHCSSDTHIFHKYNFNYRATLIKVDWKYKYNALKKFGAFPTSYNAVQ
jgi:hypothetical protein